MKVSSLSPLAVTSNCFQLRVDYYTLFSKEKKICFLFCSTIADQCQDKEQYHQIHAAHRVPNTAFALLDSLRFPYRQEKTSTY